MPSGTDLITWSPRVGAVGDDRYNVDADTAIAAGASDYSDPPTITEINARAGVNQIIGEYLRRRDMCTTGWVKNAVSSVSYVSAGTAIDQSWFSTMKTGIDNIRANERLSAFSWSELASIPSAGDVIDDKYYSELREALATDMIFVALDESDHSHASSKLQVGLRRSDTFYPPTTTYLQSTEDTSEYLGQRQFSGVYSKYRVYCFFQVPAGLPALGVAYLSFYYTYGQQNDHTVELYRSSSHLASLGTGDWGNLDTLEDSGTASVIDAARTDFDVDHSTISAGSGHTYIFVTNEDRTDSWPPAGPGLNEWGDVYLTTSTTRYPYLKLYTS